ncbi:MAG TPA: SLBB domain-containing protein [Steroidobacteraceae bacterium]|nr:SLBB domain-containing protein [Steroidobacteraceae bacterium]
MRLLRRRLEPLAGWAFAFLGLWLLAGAAHAQSSSSAAAAAGGAGGAGLMQMFQGLTPEQQQALMNQLGSGGALGPGTSALSFGQALGNSSQSQMRQLQQQLSVQQRRAQQQQLPLIPELQGGDWVIVEIGYSLPARRSSQATTALQQALAAQQGSATGAPQTLSPQTLQALQSLQGGSGNAAAALAQASTPATPSTELSTADKQRLDALIDVIRVHNPYQLSPGGELILPGFTPIPLLGLTESQATLRLSVVPAFQDLEVRITLLPLEKTGEEALKPFGYDIFSEYPAMIAPMADVPVPSNYVVNAGDVLDVLLYGNQNHAYQMLVGRDGRINFPELGPISVGGQLFSTVQAELESRVKRQMVGVRASVTMAETRSLEVFVMGDAFDPGSYTISGLGTITSALYAAGGISETGSLRNIELKRNGVVVDKLDLYDLLIHGSSAHDEKLLQGDVVFIPPVGPTVAVGGEVQRPAIYEIKGEDRPSQAVALAGGLKPDADTAKATLTRIEPNGRRVVLPLDLSAAGGGGEGLRNGDYIYVPMLKAALDAAVTLQGNVYTAGVFEYHPQMRLTDVIGSVDALKPNTDLHYVLIRRELPPDRHIEALSADLAAALAHPGTSADPILLPRDQVTVFDLSSRRDQIVQPVLAALQAQSTAAQPEPVVTVQGEVNVPGDYPLEPGMKVTDLIRAGGGLSDAAFPGKAELTRYVVSKDGTRHTQILSIDLSQALHGDAQADLSLEPYDVLSVKEVSQWTNQESVVLKGQVRFPGTYTIKPGETLKSVLERAGGLTQYAFPQGAVFTRVELKQREQDQMDQLAQRMKIELGVLALRAVATSSGSSGGGVGNAGNALIVGRSLLGQLQSEKAVGRLVINLREITREPASSPYDLVLRDGDELIVPKFEQEVTIIGEVQDPTSHLYNPNLSRDDYIRLSGGFTAQSDEKRIYVVRADGSVVANEGSRWFNRGSNVQIEPGDTIVVPINAEQMLPLPFWQAVTGIMYNVAIAAAAVHAL